MQKAECVALGAAGHQRPRVGGQVHELHGGELRMRTHCLGHPWSELRQVQLVYDVLRYSPMAIRHLLGTSASVGLLCRSMGCRRQPLFYSVADEAGRSPLPLVVVNASLRRGWSTMSLSRGPRS